MRNLSVTVLIAGLGLTYALHAQAPAPPQLPTGPRTGLIVGQVVDPTTGAGVPEAIVTMVLSGFPGDVPGLPKSRVIADGEGRYFFQDLLPGSYSLGVEKDGYLPGQYGRRQPTAAGENFTLGEGERRADVTIRIWKTATITGTVLDEAGEPVVGVNVRALSRTLVAGGTQYGFLVVPDATTDDRGVYRIAGLTPNKYIIAVPSSQTTVPVDVLEQVGRDRTVMAEIPINEVSVLGQPRIQQFGDLALLTLNRVHVPPATATGVPQVYRTAYYPIATTPSDAGVIAIEAGEERVGVDIRLAPVSAVTVSGRLIGPNGAPPPTAVKLIPATASDLANEYGSEIASATSTTGGRFTLLGVPASRYILKVRTPRQDGGVAPAVLADRLQLWAEEPLTVGSTDLDEVIVTLRSVLRVEGRVELQSASAAKPAPFGAVELHPALGRVGRTQAVVQPAGMFATSAIPGQYLVRMQVPPGWWLREATYDGRDVSDRPLDLRADAIGIVVVCTDNPSRLSGVVHDARGTAASAATVVVFPVDRQLWVGYGLNPRNLLSVAPKSGAYSITNLPKGEYYVAAIPEAEAGDWNDPKTLDVIARQATRVTIADGEKRTLELAMRSIR